jgi:hypothetical protein
MDSKISTLKAENQLGDINYEKELLNMQDSPTEGTKYSSGSSVYTSQSIVNPNIDEVNYWYVSLNCIFISVKITVSLPYYFRSIASIIQSEICNHLPFAKMHQNRLQDLNILTTLPPHLGGPADTLDPLLVERETLGDPELREQLLLGTVPTVDTILRYITMTLFDFFSLSFLSA